LRKVCPTGRVLSIWGGFMKPFLILSAIAVASVIASSAAAQTAENHAPVCYDKTIVLSGVPADQELSHFQVDPILAGPACTDSDRDVLQLTSVSQGTITPESLVEIDTPLADGESLTLTFTVTDGRGGSASANVTVVRRSQN